MFNLKKLISFKISKYLISNSTSCCHIRYHMGINLFHSIDRLFHMEYRVRREQIILSEYMKSGRF